MESKNSDRFAMILAVLVIVASYFGAYFLLVTQKVEPHTGAAWVRYRVGGTFIQKLFQPAHSLDGRLRPATWPAGDWRFLLDDAPPLPDS